MAASSLSSSTWPWMACINSYIWPICWSATLISNAVPRNHHRGPSIGERERRIRTAQLVDLGLVHLVAFPVFSFQMLRIQLPFRQEADDVHRILRLSVQPPL